MSTKNIFGIFLVLSVIYIGATFAIPPDAAALNKYHLSSGQLQLIRFSLAVPIVAIWMTAYYGYSKFSKYAQTVKDSSEGRAWSLIVKGLLTLALWLPISAIFSNIASYIYSKNSDMTASMTIISNYLNLVLLIVAFIYLYLGSKRLIGTGSRPFSVYTENANGLLLVFIGGIFTYLTLSNPERRVTADATEKAAYYLPDPMLVISIIIPYIIIFYLGFQVLRNISLYQRDVRGALYKQALKYLASGIGSVVVSLLALRYLSAVSSTFNSLTLKLALTAIYLLILLIAAGYIQIALGAKKLQRLEEV